MDYISTSPFQCSKELLSCVQICTKISEQKGIGYMFTANCLSMEQNYTELAACF